MFTAAKFFKPLAMEAYMRRTVLIMAIIMSIVITGFYFSASWKEQKSAPYATTGWENRASEWTALTAALYWEGHLYESKEGLWAIAWVIRNRVSSSDFPRDSSRGDTIRGVVTDGVKKGRRGGCQYSFVCNGAGESPAEFKRLLAKMNIELTLEECVKRWVEYSRIAAEFLKDPGNDPTNGANHYWVAAINPYWVKTDIVNESIIHIGSHKFGWSKVLGEDVPRIIALE